MDVFAGDDTRWGLALDARVGGSPFNVAVGLARLGQPVAFVSSISLDALGERLVRALDAEGVDTSTLQRVEAPTTLGLVGRDAGGEPTYAFHGSGGADRMLGASVLARLPAAARAIHVGSYAMAVEPAASTLRMLVDAERARRLVAYDPNVRTAAEPDLTRWREALAWMLARCHLLKLSEEDRKLLAPGRTAEEFARDALSLGVALVVVTFGRDGAVGYTQAASAHVLPPAVEAVDTVGAGDAFQAALLTWLAEHDALAATRLAGLSQTQLSSALEFAAHAAAITCTRRGADLPRRTELAHSQPSPEQARGARTQTGSPP